MNKKYDEDKIMLNEFMEEQRKKIKKGIIFMASLGLILGSVSGVASYSLAAGEISFTAKDTTWNVENVSAAIDELRENSGGSIVGSIVSYMGTKAPYGYLACDGTKYNISDYPRLASHINYQFGSYNYFGGDGETTFAVPDLRGEFLRGTGTNSHSAQGNGSSVGTHQNATVHAAIGSSDSTYLSMGKGTSLWDGFQNADYIPARTLTNRYINTTGENSNKRVPYFTSRPTNTSVLYLIKY